MIIKFQSMSGGVPNSLGNMLLECHRFRFQTFPYSTHEERDEIWTKWAGAHVIYVETVEECLGRETPEFGVFRIYDNSYEYGFMDFIVENSRVFVMNDDGKTVDKFRIA